MCRLFFHVLTSDGEDITSELGNAIRRVSEGDCSKRMQDYYFESENGSKIPSERLMKYVDLFSGRSFNPNEDEALMLMPNERSKWAHINCPHDNDICEFIYDLIDSEWCSPGFPRFTNQLYYGFVPVGITAPTIEDLPVDEWGETQSFSTCY